MRSQAKDEPC